MALWLPFPVSPPGQMVVGRESRMVFVYELAPHTSQPLLSRLRSWGFMPQPHLLLGGPVPFRANTLLTVVSFLVCRMLLHSSNGGHWNCCR
jgi:hypothetical protein